MDTISNITEVWDAGHEYLDEKYRDTKKYVDGITDPEFIIDESMVSKKVVPAGVSRGMVAKISGKTQKVVQLISDGNNLTATNWQGQNGTTSFSSGVASLKITTVNNFQRIERKSTAPVTEVVSGHTYMVKVTMKREASGNINVKSYLNGSWSDYAKVTDTFRTLFMIVVPTNSDTNFGIYTEQIPLNETVQYKDIQLFDLTAMGLSADAFIKSSALTGSYVPYTVGELWNVPAESVVSVGKNMLNFADVILFTKYNHTGLNCDINYSNQSVSITGQKSTSAWGDFYMTFKEPIKLKANVNYLLKSTATASNLFFRLENYNGSAITTVGELIENQTSKIIKPTIDIEITRLHIVVTNNTAINVPSLGIMLAYGISDTSSEYVPFSHKTTVLVPSAIKNLPDYGCSVGDIVNEIDFENGVYYHRVDSVDLGDFDWVYRDSDKLTYTGKSGFAKSVADTSVGNLLVDKYNTISRTATSTVKDAVALNSQGSICITSSKYANGTDFKNAMKGVKAVYERATHETIPLPDCIRPFPVENGGSLTLVNEHGLDMPNVIKYKKEVN